jgi:hypothetical protein
MPESELAEEFSRELHKRSPASGFVKTLLQRRVGSSVQAGLNTANRNNGGGVAAKIKEGAH